ncbi:MAG: hypothetical protein LBN43_05500 [Oscillospiraceae bacterium]|jgi:hypothetical protein|nr:hypothetical protein [Oscillospiraceae bacterium]
MMLGTHEKFNLLRSPYPRGGSAFYLYEDFYARLLRLTNFKSMDMNNSSDFIFDLKLTQNGMPVKYDYTADAGSIKLTGETGGAVEIVLTNRDHLRIRGTNAGLRLELRGAIDGRGAAAVEGVYPLPNGSGTEAIFGKYGKIMFKALTGSLVIDAPYNYAKGAYDEFVVNLLPDTQSGGFDAALHEYVNEYIEYPNYEPFDELISENNADFAEWKKKYPPVAKGYEETAEYAQWVVWSHRTKVTGGFSSNMILFHYQWLAGAASWQQSYAAMPLQNDPYEAWKLICAMFDYQDKRTGRINSMAIFDMEPATSGGGNHHQAPFQGFALDFLIRRCGDAFLTPAECIRMYPKFAKWANFWTTYRSADRGDDLIALTTPHQSGWDDASNFHKGFPTSSPDVIAFLVILFEACSRLAKGAGEDAAADDWTVRSKKLLDILINEFWDGEKFITRKDGEVVDSMSLACYQPILLGDRLPREIIDKIAAKITDESEFLSPVGLASESLKSPIINFERNFVLGKVVAPANMILSVGLSLAGKTKEADLIARRFCDKVKKEGIILGFVPVDTYPLTGEKVPVFNEPNAGDGWPWNTWSANCFLIMASSVIQNQ